MEWIGLIALGLILCYSSYLGKVKKLERKVKLLERKIGGDKSMSNLIKELVNQECVITFENDFSSETKCTVLDVDDEWVKVSIKDKKENVKIKLIRVDDIKKVEILTK